MTIYSISLWTLAAIGAVCVARKVATAIEWVHDKTNSL